MMTKISTAGLFFALTLLGGSSLAAAASVSTPTFWVYDNGVFNWGGDYSANGSPDYSSTAGTPESGPYDISFTARGPWSIWLPYAGGTVPMWDFNGAAYNYLTIDLKPTVPNQTWSLFFIQVGDKQIFGQNGQGEGVNLANYGPAPVVGKWATYAIPLTAVLTQWSSGSPVLVSSAIYKFGLQDQTGLSSNTWYIDHVGFVASSGTPTATPTVTIAAPAGGAAVSGTIGVTGTAAESGGAVSAVAVSIDGGAYAAATGTASWSFSLNTTPLANGSHTITTRATDSSGNTAAASISVVVGNAVTPPTVAITSLLNGATVFGTITIRGTAADNVAVSSVGISIDGGAYVAAAGATGWTYSLNTTTMRNGAHTVSARATGVGGASAAASVAVTFVNRHHVRLVNSPDASGQTIFVVAVDTTIDPAFPLAAVTALSVNMPSGNKNLSLLRLTAGSPFLYADEPGSMFTAEDFFNANGATMTITAGGVPFNAQFDAGAITAALGGIVGESSGTTTVSFQPGALADDARISIEPLPSDINGLRAKAMSNQGFAPAGTGREIVLASSGGFTTAALVLPFDPKQIPAGRSLADLAIGYFNPATSQWQVVENTTVAGGTLQAKVTHFSQYAPLVIMPDPALGLRGSLAYPNPAIQTAPTIRAMVGAASTVKITVFNAAGRVVHSATLSGAPTGVTAGGQFYYDHAWSGPMASGVYSAVIHAQGADGAIVKSRVQFAVIR